LSTIFRERARVAALTRSRTANDNELRDAQRDLAALVIAQHAAKVVAKAPPLTPEQRDHIATILRGGAPPGGSPRPASGVMTSPSKPELIKAERVAELDSGGDHAA
jgi:hypothetical protein